MNNEDIHPVGRVDLRAAAAAGHVERAASLGRSEHCQFNGDLPVGDQSIHNSHEIVLCSANGGHDHSLGHSTTTHDKPRRGGCCRMASVIKQNFSNNKERTLLAFKSFFYNLGGHIFDHPIWYIVCASLAAITCALAFLFINFETRADLLYALPASRARSDLAKQTALFGQPPRVNIIFILSADNSSVLTAPVLNKLKGIDDYIKYELRSPARMLMTTGKSFEPPSEPVSFGYQDVCYRMKLSDVDFSGVVGSSESSAVTNVKTKVPDCHTMSPLDLYRNERQYGQPLATRQWPYIANIVGNKIVKADLTLTDPDVRRLASGTTRLFNATGFLLFYHTLSAPSSALAQSLEWEAALIDFINNEIKPHAAHYVDHRNGRGVKSLDYGQQPRAPFSDHNWEEFIIFVNGARSWQDELGRSTSFDLRLMCDYALSFCIIAGYMMIANRTNNLVRSKSTCGLLGAISAMIGYVYGGGLCYWLGLRHTPTMHASPFLVLAIGLDNTFVVLNFYTLAFTYVKSPRERCRMALRDSGISLTITTFTSIISFLVGAAGPYLAVRNFCLVTSLGLFGGFVANIVFFYPFLCLESIAECEGRPHFLPIVPAWFMNRLPSSCFTPDTKFNRTNDEEDLPTEPLNTSSTRPSGFTTTDLFLRTSDRKTSTEVAKCDPFQTKSGHREIELTGNAVRNPAERPMHLTVPPNNNRGRPNDCTPSTSPRSNNHRTLQWTVDDPSAMRGSAEDQSRRLSGRPGGRVSRFWRRQRPHPDDGRPVNETDMFDGTGATGTGGLPSPPATGSMETAADSAELLSLDSSLLTQNRRMAMALHTQRKVYLEETLLKGRSLFEVASIQWRFRRRCLELKKELIRRGFQLPERGTAEMLWTNWQISPEDRRVLDSPSFDLVESNVRLVPDGAIGPLYKACDLVVKMSEEPNGNNGKWSRGIFLNKLGPLFSRTYLKLLILGLLATYLAVCLYGAVKYLSAGLDLENLTPPDSYLREAFRLSHDKFPIFPYDTTVVFTAPNLTALTSGRRYGAASRAISWVSRPVAGNSADVPGGHMLNPYSSNSYGTRKASDLLPLTDNDLAAYTGSSGGTSNETEMTDYLNSLGEVPWWEPETLEALLEFDRVVRRMDSTQDVLNGLLLFYSEAAAKIFLPDTTSNERRRLFHTHLYKYLSTGVVGQHVRNQFLFADPLESDPEYLPRLLGYKLTIFNYNFLNSFAQSQYMTTIRLVADSLSMAWENATSISRRRREDPDSYYSDINETGYRRISDDNDLNAYPPPHKIQRTPIDELSQRNELKSVFNDTKMAIIRDQGSWFSIKPFMETFLFFESDVTILRSTIINMSTAFIAIILASSLLMRGVTTAMLVTFIICAVDLGIFGAMGYWGIHLNILSMILLVLSIGFSVDYTVHVVHTFAHAVGSTRTNKTVETLILMCNPVTHGAISTTLGILPIYFRREFIMETFFKMTFLVVTFGFLNGVVFLPTILALKGPIIESTEANSKDLRNSIQCVMQPLLMDDSRILDLSPKLKVDHTDEMR